MSLVQRLLCWVIKGQQTSHLHSVRAKNEPKRNLNNQSEQLSPVLVNAFSRSEKLKSKKYRYQEIKQKEKSKRQDNHMK